MLKFTFNQWLAQVFSVISWQSYHTTLLCSIDRNRLQFCLLIDRIVNFWWFKFIVYLSKKGWFHQSWLSERGWNLSKMSFSCSVRNCIRICCTCSTTNPVICRISQRFVSHRCCLSKTGITSVINRIVNESSSTFWRLLYCTHKVCLID